MRNISHNQNWAARHDRAVPLLCLISISGFTILNIFAPSLVLGAALLLFLGGVPHGATERLDGPNAAFGSSGRAVRPTLGYTAMYLVFGLFVMASWLISPLTTLIGFLGLSAWHFGRSEPAAFGAVWQYLAGIWVITGSFLVYPDQTLDIFRVLIGADLAVASAEPRLFGLTGTVLARSLSVAILVGLAVQTFARPHVRLRAARTVSLIAVFICLPPIPAVAVYFFVLHSLRETASTIDALPAGPLNWLKVYAPASGPALLGGVGLLILTAAGLIPIPLASGLALAFIVPHMLPLERLTQAANRVPATQPK